MSVTQKCFNQVKSDARKGVSVAASAKRVGVQPQTVRDIRAGKKNERTNIRGKISDNKKK